MKKLSCKDLGGMNCNFTAYGKTTEEVKRIMYKHAEQKHKDVLARRTPEEKKKIDRVMDMLLSQQK